MANSANTAKPATQNHVHNRDRQRAPSGTTSDAMAVAATAFSVLRRHLLPRLLQICLSRFRHRPRDTEKFYTEVQEIILARYNKIFDWSLKAKMMGKKAIEAAHVFVEDTGISESLSAEDFLIEREDMLHSLFPTSELMPGAGRLIRHLYASGIPICLATGKLEVPTSRPFSVFCSEIPFAL